MTPTQRRAPLFHARVLKDRVAGHTFPADLAERQGTDKGRYWYRLTPEEVELLWSTAPPRMPVGRE